MKHWTRRRSIVSARLLIVAVLLATAAGCSSKADPAVQAILDDLRALDGSIASIELQYDLYVGDDGNPNTEEETGVPLISFELARDGEDERLTIRRDQGSTETLLYAGGKRSALYEHPGSVSEFYVTHDFEVPFGLIHYLPLPTRLGHVYPLWTGRISPDALMLAPEAVTVDERPCVMLRVPGTKLDRWEKTLYLDAAMRHIPRMIESRNEKDQLVSRMRLLDYREAAPGIYMPYRIEIESYRPQVEKLTGRNIGHVVALKVNQPVDASNFVLVPPPNARIVDPRK